MKWNPVGACAAVSVLVLGCDPSGDDPPRQVAFEDAQEVLEAEYCELLFSCDCQGMALESLEACGEYVRSSLEQVQPPPGVEGLVYDPYCMGELIDGIAALGCSTPTDDDADSCQRCFLYHGEKREGEVCHAASHGIDSYSDCGKRLRCNATECSGTTCTGTCVDPCLGIGSPPCGGCNDGSYCDPATEQCMPIAEGKANDEPCTGHAQCDSGYCPAGFCAQLPEKGESCEGTFVCAEGLTCDFATSTCVHVDAYLCTHLPALH
jgi:hypothetical protein